MEQVAGALTWRHQQTLTLALPLYSRSNPPVPWWFFTWDWFNMPVIHSHVFLLFGACHMVSNSEWQWLNLADCCRSYSCQPCYNPQEVEKSLSVATEVSLLSNYLDERSGRSQYISESLNVLFTERLSISWTCHAIHGNSCGWIAGNFQDIIRALEKWTLLLHVHWKWDQYNVPRMSMSIIAASDFTQVITYSLSIGIPFTGH